MDMYVIFIRKIEGYGAVDRSHGILSLDAARFVKISCNN